MLRNFSVFFCTSSKRIWDTRWKHEGRGAPRILQANPGQRRGITLSPCRSLQIRDSVDVDLAIASVARHFFEADAAEKIRERREHY